MGKRELILLLVTFFVCALTLRKSFWGLLYFFLFSTLTWQYIYTNLEPLRPIQITSVIVLISWLYYRRTKDDKTVKAPQFFLMVIFFFVMYFSRFLTGVSMTAGPYAYYMDFWKKILLFLVIINVINTEERLNIFMWIMVITYATLAFVQRHYGWTRPYIWWDYNDWSLALVSVVPIALFFIFNEKRLRDRLEAIPYTLIIAFMCLGTSSRGGFIGLIAVTCLSLIKKPKKMSRLISTIIIISTVFFLYNRLSVIHIERYRTIKTYEQERTAQMRFAAWRVGLRMFSENPVIGVGTGLFFDKFLEYADEEALEVMGGQSSNAHSMYVQLAAENGILGIGAFLLILIFTYRDILRLWVISKSDKENVKVCHMGMAIGIGLAGYLISGFFLNVGYRSDPYILMALIICAKQIATKEVSGEKLVEEKRIEFPRFNVLTRTALLGICYYLGTY